MDSPRGAGYGRLNCEPRHDTGPGRVGSINDDQHDLAICDFRLGSNALLIRHRAGQRHFHTRNTINRKSAGALHLDNHRSVSTPNSGYGRLYEALPFFPCGADVLTPICHLTEIREVNLDECVVRGASEGEQKAVLVESNGAVLFARPWGALVNRSEELFQLVKIVTAALLVLEALYRQLGYGRPLWFNPHPYLEALHGRIRLTKHPVVKKAERRDWGHGRVSR